MTVVVAAGLAGCASSSAPLLRGDPTAWVTRLDDLSEPGFVVVTAPHRASATELAGGDPGVAAELRRDGFEVGARAEYFRPVPRLSTANGPIGVIAEVERFAGQGGAEAAYLAAVQRRDGERGAEAQSTGPLGDVAHADTLTVTGPGGVQLLQVTVTVRVENVLDTVVVRGRLGGVGLEDALHLARRMVERERS